MNSNTTNEVNVTSPSPKQEVDWWEVTRKVWASRKLILMACGMGAVIGVVIGLGTPKEYTAKIFIAPESTRRGSSSGLGALTAMAGIDKSSSFERDAIYPSLYPYIIKSTPFLIRLFDVEVHQQQDTTAITLAQYIQTCQKAPWWSILTSAPARLIGSTLSLFKEKPKEEEKKAKTEINPFQLTPTEAGIAGGIASKIEVRVDKKKRAFTLFVTMQDPLVAAIVADTVRVHLQEYTTEYRTAKARRILTYYETLSAEAQAEYYEAQEKHARYADANQHLVRMTSRAELLKLQYEKNLAFTTYNGLEKQVQAAKARVERVTPVYAVIQPVIVPLTPSNRQWIKILLGCILLSGAGSVGWVLFRQRISRWLKE